MGERRAWTRRRFLEKVSASVLTTALARRVQAAAVAAPRRPNILFIFPDELRGQSLGIMGEQVRTPNIDRLAAEGVLFPNTFANCPLCCPARATMLTGLYSHKHGVRHNDFPLENQQVTIAEILRAHGYFTGFVGKWHLDGGPRLPGYVPPGPRRQGFDDFWAANECRHNYFDTWYFRDSPEMIPIRGYSALTHTELAIEFLRKFRAGPFCLFVGYTPPHFPIPLSSPVAPPEYLKLYDPARIRVRANWQGSSLYGTRREDIAGYYAAITCIDGEIGRLLKTLDELGLREDTIVVVTSDHGDMMGSHGQRMKSKPWEESIRIPGIIRYPAKIKPGERRETLLTQVDMAPTLLGLCGIQAPARMQGRDLSPSILARGGKEPPSAYIQYYYPYHEPAELTPPWRGIRTARYKYVRMKDRPWLLYDLQQDPYEMNNLINRPAYRKLQEEMEAELAGRMIETEDSWDYDLAHDIHPRLMTPEEYEQFLRQLRAGKV